VRRRRRAASTALAASRKPNSLAKRQQLRGIVWRSAWRQRIGLQRRHAKNRHRGGGSSGARRRISGGVGVALSGGNHQRGESIVTAA
jgi:hypothetical protein